MSFWKPISHREWLISHGIQFAHENTYDNPGPIGGIAQSHISWIASAHLVGLGSCMIDLALPAIAAIDRAISSGEDMGPDRFAWYGLLTEAKAMAQWFTGGQSAPQTWSEAFEQRLATWQRHLDVPSRARDRNDFLDATLALGLQAGRYADAMALFDAIAGGPTKGGVRSITTPRHLAYALCQRGLGQSPGSDADLILAGHRLLREHLAERWLHNGQYLKSAMWLKIVYEVEDSALSPAQVMLKAYDDMPTVERPDFLPAV